MVFFYSTKLTVLAILSLICCKNVLARENQGIGNERDFDIDQVNRDGKKPPFPPVPDLNRKSVNIKKSHEILRKALQEYLVLNDTDLGTYLHHTIELSEPFLDEYGRVIHLYRKVFTFIYEQYNETLMQNYAVKQFDKDKLDMCSVARYLSHQHSVSDRKTLMKRMGDALEYRCHPCTPYKRKQYGVTKVPDTSNINSDGVSPEESLIMCKEGLHETTTPAPVTTQAPTTTTKKDESDDDEMFDNYTPCIYSFHKICSSRDLCDIFLKGNVICDLVSIDKVKEVFDQIKRTVFNSITLNISPPDELIPADILSNKRTENLNLVCISNDEKIKLKVESNAFRSTKNLTKTLFIQNCDGINLDFNFLSGFKYLTNLTLDAVTNIQDFFPKLPSLPSLTVLVLNYVSGLADIQTLPNLTNGLKYVGLTPHEEDEIWNNETLDTILEWLLLSSANTLEYLSITESDYLTEIPTQIPSFKALNYLRITYTQIYNIKTGALIFSVPVVSLRLHHNSIRTIQPGALQGDFKDVEISLESNNFNKLDKAVFVPLLQDMELGTGSINLSNNEIDCSRRNICKLAWLIRDWRHLVGDKIVGACSNGTSFIELLPSGFSHCPVESRHRTNYTLPN